MQRANDKGRVAAAAALVAVVVLGVVLVAGGWTHAPQPNLLANPSFEEPVLSGGDVPGAVGWQSFNAAFTIRLAPHSGDNAFKTFGDPGGVFQDFAASPGQAWSGSAFGLNPSFDALAGPQAGFINIEWRTADGALISFVSTRLVDSTTPQGDSADDYVFNTVTGVAPQARRRPGSSC